MDRYRGVDVGLGQSRWGEKGTETLPEMDWGRCNKLDTDELNQTRIAVPIPNVL